MQNLYIILGVIIIFLILLHLMKQNDEIIEKFDSICMPSGTCVNEAQVKKIMDSDILKHIEYKDNKIHINKPVEIIHSQGGGDGHAGLNIKKNINTGENWNYIQFLDHTGNRTAWGGSEADGRFGSGE